VEQLQILFFTVSGFLVSRILIKTRLPQKIVHLMLGERHNTLSKTLFYLVTTSAVISIFIPNAITVLTLLPVLELLSRAFRDNGNHRLPTILTLAVIYGSNIGGMGSVTGTPSNLVLIGYLKANNVAGVDQLTYIHWLIAGIPLVIILVFVAWGVLCLGFQTWRENSAQIRMPFAPEATEHVWQRRAVYLTLVYLLSSCVLSYLMTELPDCRNGITIASGVVTVGFAVYLFSPRPQTLSAMLVLRDLVSGLPTRGLELLVIVIVVGAGMYVLNIETWLSGKLVMLIPDALPLLGLLLIIALITTFTTEIFSNTVVQLSLFLILLPLSKTSGYDPVKMLLVVTLSCTCAFMSPIATPVNALAFGGSSGRSLWRWVVVGALMNTVTACVIAYYVFKICCTL